MQVRLITKTTGVEGTEYEGKSLDEIIVGQARLSSSREINELFDEPYKLLRHCIMNGHWSVFGMANLSFEVITSRAMGRELLRHNSIKSQEFSQRYAEATEFEEVELRLQSKSNRQSSTIVCDDFEVNFEVKQHLEKTKGLYGSLLKLGVAKETARLILPETTQTKLIMNGGVREWITTLNQRLHHTAQKEVRLPMEEVKNTFLKELPIISKALFNFEDAYLVHILDRVILEKYKVYEVVKSRIVG